MSSRPGDPDRFYDAVIVGAGPAGLTAALVLGRCRRSVIICDDGQLRNASSAAAHGVFTRDGTPPETLQRMGLEDLAPYDVAIARMHVETARAMVGGFEVRAGDITFRARKLLLATGMRDRCPEAPGFLELQGKGIFHCPYCDGWEVRDGALGGYAPGPGAADYALGLLTWSRDVKLFTEGTAPLDSRDRERLGRHSIQVYEERIANLEQTQDRLSAVRLVSGERVPVAALFLHAGQEQRSPLARQLGCECEPNEAVCAGPQQRTNVPGLYIAGDAAANVQSIMVAAAEGYIAAVAINHDLRAEDFP